jgi:hypothetical protein
MRLQHSLNNKPFWFSKRPFALAAALAFLVAFFVELNSKDITDTIACLIVGALCLILIR